MEIIDPIATLILELKQEMYLHNEQPMTCPRCGSRTNILFDISHLIEMGEIHRCLNRGCRKVFIATEDVNELIKEIDEGRTDIMDT
jgi:hypothetical protein